jgi:hypothetical protein
MLSIIYQDYIHTIHVLSLKEEQADISDLYPQFTKMD